MSCLSGRQHVYVHLLLKETKNELQKNKSLGFKKQQHSYEIPLFQIHEWLINCLCF